MQIFRNHIDWRLTGRWMLYSVIVGIMGAVGALIFSWLVDVISDLALADLAGHQMLLPGGESTESEDFSLQQALYSARRWLLLVIPTVGGLVTGWLVYTYAPEAEGHGTDAVIRAFHRERGVIRPRVAIIKTLASAITIGTGGSAGKEGPIAQIGGAMASFLGGKLHFSDRDRRMLLVAGVAAGVGSIFRSPLGGAFFAVEVLYRDDIESEAIMPSVIASITGYSIFSTIKGSGTVFQVPRFEFVNPLELLPLVLLAVLCTIVGITFIKVFYGARNRVFRPMKIPPHFKPAIGGLMVGIIALYFPAVLGSSYGWLQQAMYGNLTGTLMILIALAKIVSTTMTIASGGSGGVFAPSLVIGGLLGGAAGQALHSVFPSFVTQPAAYVMIGMATFFTAVANVPITATIMISEMTGSYTLLVPLIFAAVVAHLLARKWSLYTEQVPSPRDSPAHRLDLASEVIGNIRVKSIITRVEHFHELPPSSTLEDIISVFTRTREVVLPVLVDEQSSGVGAAPQYSGLILLDSIQPFLADKTMSRFLVAVDLEVPFVSVRMDDSLEEALRMFEKSQLPELPVLDRKGFIISFLRPAGLIAEYERALLRRKAYPDEA